MIKQTRYIMGMPVTIIINDSAVNERHVEPVFDFFRYTDEVYSPFKETSSVSAINRGDMLPADYSDEMRHIVALAASTSEETGGYFAMWHNGVFDPSGIVKGWAIQKAALLLSEMTQHYYVEAGGDIQVNGNGPTGDGWKIGIRNPFNHDENIAHLTLHDAAIATSGTAIRGQHIYNPFDSTPLTDIVSLSVVAPRIIDADRMATAAFAMGRKGIYFLEGKEGYDAFMIDAAHRATQTTGWQVYERSFV